MSFASSFWGFVETVKQKSEEIVNIYKEDLSEFSKTIVEDTTTVVQEKLADLQLDKKLGTRGTKAAQRNQNQYQARIALLQKDEHTYTEAPTESVFEEWASSFNIGAHTETITHLLTSNESVREFHTRLVPAQVSYRDFWCRYYYRLHKLEQEEQRRAALVKSTIENDEEDFNWDDEDDSKHGDKGDESNKPAEHKEKSPKEPKAEPVTEKAEEKPPQEVPSTTQDPEPMAEPEATPIKESEPQQQQPEPTQAETVKEPTEPSSAPIGGESTQDDIDREIEQKYLQIQSSPTQKSKLEGKAEDDDEWGSWE